MNTQALDMNHHCFEPIQFSMQENKESSGIGVEAMEAVLRSVQSSIIEPSEFPSLDPRPLSINGEITVVDKVSLTSWSPDQRTISMFSDLWRQRGSLSSSHSSSSSFGSEDSTINTQPHGGAQIMDRASSNKGIYSNDLFDDQTDTKLVSTKIGREPSTMGEPSMFKPPVKFSIRYRPYKQDLWNDRFEDLIHFQRRFGHCLVPNDWDNKALAQWVKRQRYQYKLQKLGRHSTLTDKRIKGLEELGFVWSSHGATWEERYIELLAFEKEMGHCNVPSNFPENHQLAIWVKCQRRQHKRNVMTKDRYHKLNDLGFVWDHRKLAVEKKNSSTSSC